MAGKDGPGRVFFDVGPGAADDDPRPWWQRGFFCVEPVSPYANQSSANQRRPEYLVSDTDSDNDGDIDFRDPKEGYPETQDMSKDMGDDRKKVTR